MTQKEITTKRQSVTKREVYTTNGLRLLIDEWGQKMPTQDYNRLMQFVSQNLDAIQTAMDKEPAGRERAKWANKFIQDLIERDKVKRPKQYEAVTCKRGCGGCCHQEVEVTDDEAKLLASLVQNGIKIDLEKCERQSKLTHTPQSWWKQPDSERSCLFLGANNECRIYANRPMTCRKYFVTTEPSLCSKVSDIGSITVGVAICPDAEIATTAVMDFDKHSVANIPKAIWKYLK